MSGPATGNTYLSVGWCGHGDQALPHFYRLDRSDAPWGDYGDILRNGLLAPNDNDKETREVAIERAGPFVPPITFPLGAIVVTEAAKEQFERGAFSGLRFARARYAKVVRLDWHDWDKGASEPKLYPASGEPEDYVLSDLPPVWSRT